MTCSLTILKQYSNLIGCWGCLTASCTRRLAFSARPCLFTDFCCFNSSLSLRIISSANWRCRSLNFVTVSCEKSIFLRVVSSLRVLTWDFSLCNYSLCHGASKSRTLWCNSFWLRVFGLFFSRLPRFLYFCRKRGSYQNQNIFTFKIVWNLNGRRTRSKNHVYYTVLHFELWIVYLLLTNEETEKLV